MRQNLLSSLQRLSQLQRSRFDVLELQQILDFDVLELQQILEDEYDDSMDRLQMLRNICRGLLLPLPKRLDSLDDPSLLPLLIFNEEQSWGTLKGVNARGEWIAEWFSPEQGGWTEVVVSDLSEYDVFLLKTNKRIDLAHSRIFQMVKTEIVTQKKWLIDAFVAGVFVNIVSVMTAFYTMQIYDRVVPTGAKQTLLVLTLGVLLIVFLEFIAKLIRSGLYEKLVENVDRRLSRNVYKRFLSLRMDQLPKSVGSLASQMRGYESVRGFLSSVATYFMVDLPFVLFYLAIIFFVGGLLALVPIAFFVLAVSVGLYSHKRIEVLAAKTMDALHFKVGLLVESVEGAETIKSGQGGWRMLSRWMSVTDQGRGYDLEMKRVSDRSLFMAALFQQFSYVLMVASGSLLIGGGKLTMGGLIACSILSGRILAPVAQLPSHLVQWANTKASIRALDAIWELKCDHDNIEQPIVPETIVGRYSIEPGTQMNYGEREKQPPANIAEHLQSIH